MRLAHFYLLQEADESGKQCISLLIKRYRNNFAGVVVVVQSRMCTFLNIGIVSGFQVFCSY